MIKRLSLVPSEVEGRMLGLGAGAPRLRSGRADSVRFPL
jgi:hypothetical protein